MELKDALQANKFKESDFPSIDQSQPNLYEAVKNGDLKKIKSELGLPRANKDLDLLDSSGKTIIQVAADLNDASDRDDAITLLLSGGASLQLALLNTVHEGDVRVVEILLQFCDQQPQTPSPKMLSVRGHTSFTTPLNLAARLQNFQIVKLFLEHGFTIEDPKTMRMSTEFTDVSSEKLHSTVHRLNEYRTMASPVFIAASFLQNVRSGPDPVLRACALSKEFRDISEQEYEFRKEYLTLCNDCEEFTVSLLKECCTQEEIRCVMEAKSEGKRFLRWRQILLTFWSLLLLPKRKRSIQDYF
ncbi:short transient receptor potential channel 4-like [Porites lutea]|uniref:short transient receptor potential channel 4-like n=1 Tax=Porites lutea TaxID=51062 RepID=UPI003CC6CE8B